MTNLNLENKNYISYEYLAGTFDKRADSCLQCLRLFKPNTKVKVKTARLVEFEGEIKSLEKIKNYLINPVEMQEKNLNILKYNEEININKDEKFDDFCTLNLRELKDFLIVQGLAISIDDLVHIQKYFRDTEKRNPSKTEIMVLDTYWSDHCRHSTFETNLENITIKDELFKDEIEEVFARYLELRKELKRSDKPKTLMDLATIFARYQKKIGLLEDLEKSNEINACSIVIDVKVGTKSEKIEKWLLMFKNETHNHPTEIEPFGGASTCVGGAIRDPLSGRAYVYQALRISGAGDITQDFSKTLNQKLPQEKISKEAALGFSSYGNQIGVATSFIEEIFHDGYVAKRMEVGAVVGAVKQADVSRLEPENGDLVVLLGGETGRDGVGGASGSSKGHDENSLLNCSCEVQKGNAPMERKIQRLFKNPKASKLIKKANDFGAGGVCVAVGELAPSLEIYLDKVFTKYKGLSPRELALSESQERMAVLLAPSDLEIFLSLVENENLQASVIAKVTDSKRLIMKYKEKIYFDIKRDFIDTNGIRQNQDVVIDKNTDENQKQKNPFEKEILGSSLKEKIFSLLQSQNVASLQGMNDMFDFSIGRTSVLAPFGGKYQLSKSQASVHKIPSSDFTKTCSLLSYGFNPDISKYSPFLGSQYALIQSLANLVSSGGDYKKARLSFQEYFEKLEKNPSRWGKVSASLLGALKAQEEFGTPAIGGKDSMSGSFKDLNVPPTLISFAVATEETDNIISSDFKECEANIYLVKAKSLEKNKPNYSQLKDNFLKIYQANLENKILSAGALSFGGLVRALLNMSFGSKVAFEINSEELFDLNIGGILIQSKEELDFGIKLGKTSLVNKKNGIKINNEIFNLDELIKIHNIRYEKLYPKHEVKTKQFDKNKFEELLAKNTDEKLNSQNLKAKKTYLKPKVLLPVFSGTNCEYDMQKAFLKAGADVEIFVFNNLDEKHIKNSLEALEKKIKSTQVLALSGGFSLADEPDGSGKFIANILKNEKIAKAIKELLKNEGLILGICNGFQALIKSGLLPFEDIVSEDSPTLFRNANNRHISKMAYTKIASNSSPWLSSFKVGEVHNVPLSHGEGRIVLSKKDARRLFENAQVSSLYCDENGTLTDEANLNASDFFIESLVSKSGQIFGKMAHSERYEEGLFKNIYGNKEQDIFKNAINYFKKEKNA